MQINLEKIKKLPPDVKKDFFKMYLKYSEKKQEETVRKDFLSFVKYIWPDFIQGYHHKIGVIMLCFNHFCRLGRQFIPFIVAEVGKTQSFWR